MVERKAKQCPFCGSEDLSYDGVVVPKDVSDQPDGYIVACANCNASGPLMDTPEAAIEVWNNRVGMEPKEWENEHFIGLSSGWMVEYKNVDGSIIIAPVPGLLVQNNGLTRRFVACGFLGLEIVPLNDQIVKVFFEHRNRHRGGNLQRESS